MIRGAIFDVDGTLLDSMEIWEGAGIRYLKKIGKEPEEGLSNALFPMSLEESARYLQKQYHIQKSAQDIVGEVLETVRGFYLYEVSLKKGVSEFLAKLKEEHIPMAIATANNKEDIEAAFQRLGIIEYFVDIVTCTEVGESKHSPQIYKKAAERIKTSHENTYVFEDVLYAIQTAKNAGFQTVGVYDRTSEADWDNIKKTADIYLPDMTDFTTFWKQASAK